MYTPPHFREDRIDVLHSLIGQFPLATLVTTTPAGLEATHIPFLLENGILRGHVARDNPIANAGGAPALAIFQGPQHYISPSWYASKSSDSRVVPTWNYVAVHAHGPIRTFTDKAGLLRIVSDLTLHFESRQAAPWSIHDAPPEYIDKLLNAITGVEISIERLEGKWKVSQNRPGEDRVSVMEALSGHPMAAAIKAAIS
ncbi:MAG: FMN-binding negative transcriptional regulator [Bryobacteraceae bacterium]